MAVSSTVGAGVNTISNSSTAQSLGLLTFAPADITIYMGGRPVRSVLSLTYSITREVVALFGMGDANAMGFNKGKRGIAGSLVMNTFTNHPLLRSQWATAVGLFNPASKSNPTLLNLSATTSGDLFKATVTDYAIGTNGSFEIGTNPSFGGSTFNTNDATLNAELATTYNWVANQTFNYVDQLPPFDIQLTFVNELGMAATMVIEDVLLANEGGGFSVDDITSETAFTYVARSIQPMRAYTPAGASTASPSTSYA